MSTYHRPAFPVQEYRDDLGRPISYGQRWEGSPPEDAYSRISYPERFAPLHAVADALIDWLQETFDVSVDESPEVASDLLRPPEDVVRAVRIVPSDKRAAGLSFVLTGFPGVYLHAGALHDFHFPVCGCDACDEGVLELADDLEWTVRTVVQGGYAERFFPGGSGSSTGWRRMVWGCGPVEAGPMSIRRSACVPPRLRCLPPAAGCRGRNFPSPRPHAAQPHI
jgi:hypothetical protein